MGFAPPALFTLLGWLHGLYPSVPSLELYAIPLGKSFVGASLPWSVLGDMQASIIWSVIGVSCLLPGEVSLSLWLFYVLFRVQLLLWGSLGIAEEGGTSNLINPRSFINMEEAGGFIALSLVVLYQSRKTIYAAFLDLLGRSPEEADPYWRMRGRTALLVFLLANAAMVWWAIAAGTQGWAFAIIMGMFYAVLIGASRLVAAGGVMYVDTGFFPRWVILRTLGATMFTPMTHTVLTYLSVIYTYDPMNLPMPQVMDSLKLVHSSRLKGRQFSWAALLSVVVMLGVGLPAILKAIYSTGATSLAHWPFTSYPSWAFGELDATFRTPEFPDNFLRLALVLGAGIMFALVWLNTRFIWWPVSPVGFIIASAYETNRSLWLNVFIAWLVTTVIKHYGGLRLYRSLPPGLHRPGAGAVPHPGRPRRRLLYLRHQAPRGLTALPPPRPGALRSGIHRMFLGYETDRSRGITKCSIHRPAGHPLAEPTVSARGARERHRPTVVSREAVRAESDPEPGPASDAVALALLHPHRCHDGGPRPAGRLRGQRRRGRPLGVASAHRPAGAHHLHGRLLRR